MKKIYKSRLHIAAWLLLCLAAVFISSAASAGEKLYFDGTRDAFVSGGEIVKSEPDSVKGIIKSGVTPAERARTNASPSAASFAAGAGTSGKVTLALAMSTIMNPEMWHIENDVLYRHLPEAKYGTEQTVWARVIGNSMNMDYGLGFSVSQKYWGAAFGVDNPFPINSDRLVTGFMMGYGKADRDFDIGDSTTKSFFTAIYAKYDLGSGAYLAGSLKYNRYSNTVSAATISDGGHVKQNGFGGSIEAGREFKMQNGWYWEPSLRYSYMQVRNSDLVSNRGVRVIIEGYSSQRLRGAVRVGRRFALANGSRINAWLSAAVLQEFDDASSFIHGAQVGCDYPGTRGAYSAGLEWALRDTLSLSAMAEYARGGGIEQHWGMELGLNIKVW